MHGDPCRLVNDQQRVVFVNDGEFEGGDGAGRVGSGNPHRRNAHLVAQLQAVAGINPSFVYADFAAPQNAVNMALGHAFQHTKKVVVDALVLLGIGDGHTGDGVFAYIWHFAYTSLRSERVVDNPCTSSA